MSKDLPFFKFYPSKWLEGDIRFSAAHEQGAFMCACVDYWVNNGVLSIARLKHRYGDAIDALINQGILKVKDENIVIEFLDEQLADIENQSKINSHNGSKGAAVRWRKDGEAMARDGREDKIREDKIRSNAQPGAAVVNLFVLFWAAYPKKKSKGDAEKAWKAIKPDLKLTNRMIDKINQLKKTPEWTKDGGQFIPYPATWLRAKGWEDEVVGAVPEENLDEQGRPPKTNPDATWNEGKKRWEVKSTNFFNS